jgi:hypothetical protein
VTLTGDPEPFERAAPKRPTSGSLSAGENGSKPNARPSTLTMVELVYGGYRRLVEPYKLEYYVRKSDGIGQEYFWGYDRSGGKSGATGIKMFICNKIQNVQLTQIRFSPRYDVEL